MSINKQKIGTTEQQSICLTSYKLTCKAKGCSITTVLPEKYPSCLISPKYGRDFFLNNLLYQTEE